VALARSVSGPIEKLTEGMARYGRGELGHQIPERPGAADELELLVRQFNRMGRELEAQRQRLRVAEALGAWQEVARVLAHELTNPLTAMRMALARLARSTATAEGAEGEDGVRRRESLALLEEELEALLRMTRSFSDLAKLPAPSPRPVELGTILGEVCGLYRDASPVPIECAAVAATVHADPDLLRRAFGNLVKNAVEASRPSDGPIRVDVQRDGGLLRVVVSDHGVGIPAALDGVALARSRGSSKPQGSGLGLPIAHKILHEHGGSLRLEPGPDGGTRAVATLGAARAPT
jgi:nitrogen fixation/metabolism regulation signal transduction histidine kinase